LFTLVRFARVAFGQTNMLKTLFMFIVNCNCFVGVVEVGVELPERG
jgi:hypothetical protein